MNSEHAEQRNAIRDRKRQQYLAREISHDEYYLWLADLIHFLPQVLDHLMDQVSTSTDPHLNDVPLHLWDNLHFVIRPLAAKVGLSWSLSDSVCTAKAKAKQLANQSPSEA